MSKCPDTRRPPRAIWSWLAAVCTTSGFPKRNNEKRLNRCLELARPPKPSTSPTVLATHFWGASVRRVCVRVCNLCWSPLRSTLSRSNARWHSLLCLGCGAKPNKVWSDYACVCLVFRSRSKQHGGRRVRRRSDDSSTILFLKLGWSLWNNLYSRIRLSSCCPLLKPRLDSACVTGM